MKNVAATNLEKLNTFVFTLEFVSISCCDDLTKTKLPEVPRPCFSFRRNTVYPILFFFFSFCLLLLVCQDCSPVPQAQRRGLCHPERDPSRADVTRWTPGSPEWVSSAQAAPPSKHHRVLWKLPGGQGPHDSYGVCTRLAFLQLHSPLFRVAAQFTFPMGSTHPPFHTWGLRKPLETICVFCRTVYWGKLYRFAAVISKFSAITSFFTPLKSSD